MGVVEEIPTTSRSLVSNSYNALSSASYIAIQKKFVCLPQ